VRLASFVGLALVLAVLASSCHASTPIDAEIEQSKGKLMIVEFVDYECSFCQDIHAVLAPLLEEQQGNVRVVIKHVPLEKHPGAKRAAAAAICAEAQGKLPAMHDALMKGASKTDEGLLDLAQNVGLDIETFKSCLRSDVPSSRMATDTKTYEQMGGDGLPMLFIQHTKLVGMQDAGSIEKALREASH